MAQIFSTNFLPSWTAHHLKNIAPMKPTLLRTLFVRTALLCLMIAPGRLLAQPYETYLVSGSANENFDELGIAASAALPTGWVFAQGVGLPTYNLPANCQSPPVRFTNAPVTCQNCTRDYDDLNTGGSGTTPTGGGRINWGTSSAADRCVGFMGVHSTATPPSSDFWAPTNYIMFGFYNNTGSNIVGLTITNNIKQFRQNTTAATVTFFYSYDGTNWTHYFGGDVGPFPSGASTYYFANPAVSNSSFTVSGLGITNGTPFYLAWQFIISTANGSSSQGLGFDDFGLTATFGNVPPPAGNSRWTAAGGNWNTAANWLGNVLPTSGNNLTFAGAGGIASNNLPAVSSGSGTVGSLTFSNTAGSYTLNGNGITLANNLTNNSAASQSIALPISLLTDENFAAQAGSLVFGAAISNGNYGVNFVGPNNITLNGSILGTGPTSMSGTGTLTVNGAVASLNQFNANSGTVALNGTLTSVGQLNLSGTLSLGSAERINDGATVTVNSGGLLNLNNFNETVSALAGSGTVNLGSGSLSLSGGSSATFSGSISGTGGFTKNGASTETISATNYYHGPTLLTSGTLAIANVATLGDGPLLLAGGIFQLTGTRDVTNGLLVNAFVLASNTIVQNTTSATAGTRNLPFGGTVIATNGTLTIQNIATGNYTNILNVRFYGAVSNFTQPIVFDNSLAGSQVNNIGQLAAYNTNGSAPQLYSGVISGPGHFYRGATVPGTGGFAILTGNNTFTLDTIVNRGFLGIGADSVSSAGNLVTSPVGLGTLTFDDDTQNGLAGVGVFAYGGAHTIANRVLLNGVTNTAILGTNALNFSGNFDVGSLPKIITVSNTALTTISGPLTNTASLTLAGAGALELTTDNSSLWTGAWTITGGTLLADNASGSATGTNAVTITGGALGGFGTVAGAVTASGGGAIAPGNGVGTLTLQNGLNLAGGGKLIWELGANTTSGPGTSYDTVALTGGSLALGGSSSLTLSFTGSATAPSAANVFWLASHTWKIISLSGTAANAGATKFTAIANGIYNCGSFSNYVDAGGNVMLAYNPGSPFYAAYDAGAGLFGGENLILTNSAGQTFLVWASANGALAITNWTLVGTMSEQPLNNGTGNSYYSINVTPSASPTYYLVGKATSGPYQPPIPVTILTGNDSTGYVVAGTNVTITSAGVLALPSGAVTPPPVISPKIVNAGVGNAIVSWSSVSGAGYTLQYKTNLNQATWTTFGSTTANGTNTSLTDTTGAHNLRFYRVTSP